MKVLAILYRGGAAAQEEPRLLGALENELGLRQYLESQGHEYLVRSTIILLTAPYSHATSNRSATTKKAPTASSKSTLWTSVAFH